MNTLTRTCHTLLDLVFHPFAKNREIPLSIIPRSGNDDSIKERPLAQNEEIDQLRSETKQSELGYPAHYRIRPFEEQIQTPGKLFGLKTEEATRFVENLPPLPEGAEGWFAFPRFQSVASTYSEATREMLRVMGKTRHLRNWYQHQLNAQYIYPSRKTLQVFEKIGRQQTGDILIVPAQFGLRHRGKSPRSAEASFAHNEFGLGTFATGCMLLTHPKREEMEDQLHIICSGDVVNDCLGDTALFTFTDGKLHFSNTWTDDTDQSYGTVSGFLPKEWL